MTNAVLQIRNVSKSYFRKKKVIKEALRNVSLDLYQGEVLGLLGVNGAGKTTLASIIATLHPPTSGDIQWEGKSVYNQLITYRKKVGLCPQHRSIEKNISMQEALTFAGRCYGLSKSQAALRKDELLTKCKLEEYADSFVDELSGGYKQRFMIARSLMHNPRLVILDEPTVGLDPHIRRELWELIRELKASNITVLLTTHYLDEAEVLSDRVCLIHDGSIRTVDTPTNLKKHHQKNSLEEVFLKFVDDPDAQIFNSVSTDE